MLYHHGCSHRRSLMVGDGREWLAAQPLPETAREQVTIAIAMIDALDRHMAPLDKELRAYARWQPGCKALMAHYGIGELTAVTILAELGDARRFANSRDAVRYAGLDITVYQSDQHRAPGKLSRQGPPALRWALDEAAQVARRPGSPDRAYYLQAAERLGGNRACLAVARKLLKRCYHTLRELGDQALCPPDPPGARRALTHTDAPRPAPEDPAAATSRVDGLERSSGRNASPSGTTPSNIMSPARSQPGSRTEVSPGARAHNMHPRQRAQRSLQNSTTPRQRP